MNKYLSPCFLLCGSSFVLVVVPSKPPQQQGPELLAPELFASGLPYSDHASTRRACGHLRLSLGVVLAGC